MCVLQSNRSGKNLKSHSSNKLLTDDKRYGREPIPDIPSEVMNKVKRLAIFIVDFHYFGKIGLLVLPLSIKDLNASSETKFILDKKM